MLYHKNLGIPAQLMVVLSGLKVALTFSRHAKMECLHDKRELIFPPLEVNISPSNIVEVDAEGRVINKVLVRFPYSDKSDLLMALIPEPAVNMAHVKTCWLNDVNDNHATLREERYQ